MRASRVDRTIPPGCYWIWFHVVVVVAPFVVVPTVVVLVVWPWFVELVVVLEAIVPPPFLFPPPFAGWMVVVETRRREYQPVGGDRGPGRRLVWKSSEMALVLIRVMVWRTRN